MIQKLLRHTAIYGLVNVFVRASILISLLVLAGILGPHNYGAYAMLTLIGAIAAMLVPLQVTQGLARYYSSTEDESDKARYASTAWWFTVATQAGFLIVFEIVARWGTERLLGDPIFIIAFRLALAGMVLNTLFFFLQCQFRWSFRVWEYSVATLIYGFLYPAFSIGMAVAWARPLEGALIGQALALAVPVLWSLWRLRATLCARLSSSHLRQMLAFAFPLLPGSLAVLMVGNAPRIVVNDLGSLSDVGVFAVASQLGAISTIIVAGLQGSLFPFISVHHADPGAAKMLGRLFEAFCAVALVVCLGLGLFAADGIAWVGAAQYARAGPLVLLVAPAALLLEIYIFAPGFWIGKRTDIQAGVCVAVACVSYGICYILTSRFGLLGGAVGSLVSAGTFFGCWWIVASRYYYVPVAWTRVNLYLLTGASFGAATLLLTRPGTLDAAIVKVAVLSLATVLALALGLFRWRAMVSILRS